MKSLRDMLFCSLGGIVELGIPSGLTLWDLLNSNAMGSFIGAIATIVAAFVGGGIIKRVKEQTEQVAEQTEVQKKTAAEEQRTKRDRGADQILSDEGLEEVEAQAESGRGKFSNASRDFKRISESVELLVRQIPDGRRRRKYQGLRKTDLRDYIYLLWQDDVLGLAAAQSVDEAISDFYSYRTRPGDISDAVVEKIKRAADLVSSNAKSA